MDNIEEAESIYSRIFPLKPTPKTIQIIALVLDKGKVTIPKTMREYLNLKKGDLAQLIVSKASGDKKE